MQRRSSSGFCVKADNDTARTSLLLIPTEQTGSGEKAAIRHTEVIKTRKTVGWDVGDCVDENETFETDATIEKTEDPTSKIEEVEEKK